MGTIEFKKELDPTSDFQEKLDGILPEAISFMDFVGQIYLEFMQPITPIGETQDLYDQTEVTVEDQLTRWIGSLSDHFQWVVPGHTIAGPLNTEKQKRWWFWYLNNVLGGEYNVKYGTGNKTPPYDYPAMAFDMADGTVDQAIEEFGNWIVS